MCEAPKDHVSTVAAEDLWGRHGWGSPGFVGVTEDELARLYRTLMWVRPRAPVDSTAGWPIPSLNPNEVRPVGSW